MSLDSTWRQHTDIHLGKPSHHCPDHLKDRFLKEAAKASTGYATKMGYAVMLMKDLDQRPHPTPRGLAHPDEQP
jgi:hypothetical protein